ncbi:MAG: NAD(P)/FAD-dependent oxidoreductase [Acidobacteria bacterium]|nr:NAD(P)/FAD-dependent oxidoreductase [Acidobacteriota bacterium]
MIYDAIVIGGGAAGLFCAVTAAKRGKRVLVVEHNSEVGRKILISGGGRCNFTNVNTTADNFVSANPHFCKSALARFTPRDFIDLVERYKIPYYEKKLGQLFCRESSRAIVQMLLDECRRAKVRVETSCSVSSVNAPRPWLIETNKGAFEAEQLVVACGGLSFPKIGASDLGFRIARQFGLKIEPTRPSLVALVSKAHRYPRLAGISLGTVVSAGGPSFRENILFTHKGLSGPAILQASNYWSRSEPIEIDLLPDTSREELASTLRQTRSVASTLGTQMPQRAVNELFFTPYLTKRGSELSEHDRSSLIEAIKKWRVEFQDTEGWDRAEVTRGGVSTSELSSKTMMSKKMNGLYFIGEVVDVTGWLGGYNFQWAWASGYAAGCSI